jgi:hypothetical protein
LQSGKVDEIQAIIDTETNSLFSISSIGTAPMVNVQIHNQMIRVKLDTGASVNVIDEYTFNLFKPKPILRERNHPLYSYNSSTPLVLLGKFDAPIKYKDRVLVDEVVVVKRNHGNLLSCQTCMDLELVTILSEIKKNQLSKIHSCSGKRNIQRFLVGKLER